MTEHSRKYYTCDLCKVEMDKPYSGGENGTYTLKTSSDYAVTGHAWAWKDLCKECNDYVGRIISDLETKANKIRKDKGCNT